MYKKIIKLELDNSEFSCVFNLRIWDRNLEK